MSIEVHEFFDIIADHDEDLSERVELIYEEARGLAYEIFDSPGGKSALASAGLNQGWLLDNTAVNSQTTFANPLGWHVLLGALAACGWSMYSFWGTAETRARKQRTQNINDEHVRRALEAHLLEPGEQLSLYL